MGYFQKAANRLILPVLAVTIFSFFTSCHKDEVSIYLPETDNLAISFRHKFHLADYEEGRRIVIENFSKAIDNSGQTRRTYFMSFPDSSEVFVVSFFHPESSTTKWLNSEERDAVLATLRPLYREPLEVQEYNSDLIHNTHINPDNSPQYFPEAGDEVLVFNGHFKEEDYRTGKAILNYEFPNLVESTNKKRRTYSLFNAAASEALEISFFHPEGSAQEWLNDEERKKLAAEIDQLVRIPASIKLYTLDRVLNSN